MADTANAAKPAPRKKRTWLRVIAWFFGVLVLLIIAAYFVGTSSAFFKGVILPRAGAALNARISVSDASISPFHEVTLNNLRVETTGTEPLLTAQQVRLRYSLMDIIGGNIHVQEITVTSPTITLVENANKTSNLDPILKKVSGAPSKPQAPTKPSKPMQLNIEKLQITNAKLQQIQLYGAGKQDLTELSNVNVTAENLRNGQNGKITLDGVIDLEKNPPAPATAGALQANLNGSFAIGLTPALQPGSIEGSTKLAVMRAEGALAQAANLGTTLACDITPTEIKQVALRFAKGDTQLGQLLVSGPFDMQKVEGRLDIRLFDIDKNLLNLAGASSGLDFGPTTVNSTNEVQLANGGKSITTAGQFNLDHLQVTRTNETTPSLDLHARYDVTVDSGASKAVLRVFTLNAIQNSSPIIEGKLTSPMTISWGTAGGVGNSTLNLAVTHLELTNWKAFLGNVAPSGDVNMKLQLVSQEGAKQLSFDLKSDISDLTAVSGTNELSHLAVSLSLQGEASDLKQFSFPAYKLTLLQQQRPLINASGSGSYDLATTNAEAQIEAELMLPALLQALPQPGINVSSGTFELKARVSQKVKNQDVSGDLALAGFTGQVGSNSFKDFGATATFDVGMTPAQAQIRKVAGQLTQGKVAGGAFSLAGTYGLSNQVAQLTTGLTDFNQNGLSPFLQPLLAGKQLVSVDLNANAAVNYDPQAASSIKADLQVTNLVVHDPKGQFPSPLALGLQLDTGLNKKVVDIHQCQVSLTPTARAKNQVQLTGKVDMTQSNAIQGNLELAADSLDLTTYYDLFAGQKTTPAKPAEAPTRAAAPVAQPSAGAAQAAPTTQLPLRNFTADATIGSLYLHEVMITNFLMTAKVDGGHVVLDPCKLSLNGAPVNTLVDLDLGVPGYKYNLSFGAQAVPLAPLVNTFEPDRKGQIGGTFSANAKIAGTGTTGADLKKYLNGQFDLGSTNLNLSIINIRSPLLKALINVVALIPELVKNPTGALGSLAGALVPGTRAGQTGSLSSELEKSPINAIIATGNIGDGKVVLQRALVQSPAFEAEADGTVMLADILTNSTIQIPVNVLLSRSLAERFGVAPANTPTNADYAALPKFLTMTGTVGEPKPQINKVALASTVFRGLSGILSGAGVGGNTGKIMQGLGNLGGVLGGNTSTNPPGTNQPHNALGGLLQGLGGALGEGQPRANTNAPPTNNQSPVNNLLKGLFK